MDLETESKFPQALKNMRLAKRLKQRVLADLIGVKERTLASWETGERIPTIGSVIILNAALSSSPLERTELLLAYIQDDLYRQQKKFDSKFLEETFKELRSMPQEEAERIETQEAQTIQPAPQVAKTAIDGSLQQLFSLIEKLQQQPAMLPVVNDFLKEISIH